MKDYVYMFDSVIHWETTLQLKYKNSERNKLKQRKNSRRKRLVRKKNILINLKKMEDTVNTMKLIY